MNRKTLLAVTVLTATAIGGAAFADSHHGHGGQTGSNDRAGAKTQGAGPGMMDDMSGMMGMMQRMHGKMMGGDMMGGMGPMDGAMMQIFDANGDGTVTPEELREQLEAKLTEYDSDGDGTLSISEFEPLHSAMIRKMMVRKFQHLDVDGDGSITAEEMTAPADRMESMQKMRADRGQMQGQPGRGEGMGDGMNPGDEPKDN